MSINQSIKGTLSLLSYPIYFTPRGYDNKGSLLVSVTNEDGESIGNFWVDKGEDFTAECQAWEQVQQVRERTRLLVA